MSSMNTPSILTWGFRIYFYLLLILSFNLASVMGMVLSVVGFLIMEAFCEELTDKYEWSRRNELFDKHNSTPYNLVLK
jgi:hypothetical protein